MKKNDAIAMTPLPKKPKAVFHHPIGFELYDGLAMDLHAMKYAEECVKAEREECARLCEIERKALEENRLVWVEHPEMQPSEDWISDWESSACRGEEYAVAIRARGES